MKTPQPQKDALVEAILNARAPQPEEENFWLIMVRLGKSERPVWAMNGPLRPITEHTVGLSGRNKIPLPKEKGDQLQILTFQGEKAHAVEQEIKQGAWPSLVFMEGDFGRLMENMDPTTTCIAFDLEYVTLKKPLVIAATVRRGKSPPERQREFVCEARCGYSFAMPYAYSAN